MGGKMKLALFQRQDDDHKFDDVIWKFQKKMKDPDPESVHMELLFDDGAMFSSSGRGGMFAGHGLWPGIGTRFIHINDIEANKWKFYDLNITAEQEKRIRINCEKRKPMRYDWLGIIGQPLPFNLHSPWAAYCSEVGNDEICKVMTEVWYRPKLRPGEVLAHYQGQELIG
jgi:hypothetical protein